MDCLGPSYDTDLCMGLASPMKEWDQEWVEVPAGAHLVLLLPQNIVRLGRMDLRNYLLLLEALRGWRQDFCCYMYYHLTNA